MLTNWLKTKTSNASAINAAVRRKHERDDQAEKEDAFEEQLKQAEKILRREAAKPAPSPAVLSQIDTLVNTLEETPEELKRSDGMELMDAIYEAVIPQIIAQAFRLEHAESSVWDCGGEQGRLGLFHGENAAWCDCVLKCGVVSTPSEPKKRKVGEGVKVNQAYSWAKERAPVIFMILHPQIWGKLSRAEACEKGAQRLGLERHTVAGWFTKEPTGKRSCIETWYDIVHDMSWKDVKACFRGSKARVTDPFDLLDDANVHMKLGEFEPFRGDKRVLNPYTGMSAAKKGLLVRAQSNVYVILGGKGQKAAREYQPGYPAQHEFVRVSVQDRWNSGDPISRLELTDLLVQKFSSGPWYDKHVDPACKSHASNLSGWITRTLKALNFADRKRTVSQKVPGDWFDVAILFNNEVKELLVCCDVIVNADQTFLNFYVESQRVIAKKGAKRVGGNKQADEKAGCTLMVTADLKSSELLNPFLVLTGKSGKAKRGKPTLDEQYADWATRTNGTCEVTFQKKHWFDAHITVRWLKWLKAQYPAGKKIGLIWDHAPAHNSKEVQAFLEEAADWLVVVLIPEGMTSILQVCDVAANAQIKAQLRRWYFEWRRKAVAALLEAGHTGQAKLKMPRDDFIVGVEGTFKGFNREQRTTRSLEKAFQKTGSDPWSEDGDIAFANYVHALQAEGTYGTMMDTLENNQKATPLCENETEMAEFEDNDLNEPDEA